MDSWKYYDIIHRHHTYMNPVDEERLEDLYDLLKLRKGGRVTDIGCGKGEMLFRLAEKYSIRGVGIDISPYCIRQAVKQKSMRVPQADLKFLEMNGADYKPEKNESEDLATCIGASWIYGGYKKTLATLSKMAKPSGLVMVGEPFWRKTPPSAYLKREKLAKRSFNTHHGNMTTGVAQGLAPLYSLVSSEADWDKYEGLHWYATRQYANSHPEDPDLQDLLGRDARYRESYLKYQRDILGWAIYLFQKNA
jgi:ubiquinone/menaquinone biosynthesis C-methylase UbiE